MSATQSSPKRKLAEGCLQGFVTAAATAAADATPGRATTAVWELQDELIDIFGRIYRGGAWSAAEREAVLNHVGEALLGRRTWALEACSLLGRLSPFAKAAVAADNLNEIGRALIQHFEVSV